MIWIYLIFLLIQFIAYPILLIKFIRAIFNKDRSKIKIVSIWLLALLFFSGLVFKILPGSKYFWWPIEAIESKSYTKNLMGISFILPEPIYEFDSGRDFFGDGSSLTIYELEERVIENLVTSDSIFFSQYPKQGIRSDWGIEKWTKTPLSSEHQDAYYFASQVDNSSKYNLNEILTEDGNYFAYKYYLSSFSTIEKHYMNIDFYLISPKRRILIVINVNT